MNRENKLAIIIGFSLVLVVAVLISDHFSRARSAQISNEIKPGTPRDFGAPLTGLTKPIGGPQEIPWSQRPLGATTDAGVQKVVDTGERKHEPEVIDMGKQTPKPPVVGPAGGESQKKIDVKPLTPPSVITKPYATGVMQSYEIKDGDKLYSIAAKFYGSGALWQKLAEFNKAKVPNAPALKVGITLDIPPKSVLLGEEIMPPPGVTPPKRDTKPAVRPEMAKPAPGGATDRAIAGKAEKPEKVKKPVYEMYVIKKGDDLSTIAQRLLGSSRRAGEIYELNKDVLEDEHTVIAGVEIKLPTR